MKRMRLLAAVLAGSIVLSLAATSSHAETQIGVIGGLNIANLSIDGSSSLNVRTTFAIGGVVDFGISERFPVGANRLGIDGRVSFGLVDINEGGTVTFDGAPLDVPGTSTKTLDFRLLATYLFPWPGSN